MRNETLTMSDGAAIYLADMSPSQKPRAVVQFVHGFSEHSGRYIELGERFRDQNIAFVMHDQRGHGRTPGKRGVAPSYDKLLDDVEAVRGRIDELYPETPVIIYGHSMGGNITANFMISRTQKRHVCAVICAPWIRLYKPYSTSSVVFASIAGKLTSKLGVVNPPNFEILTHDEEIIRRTREDPYFHGRLSFRLFTQITAKGEYAIMRAKLITLPALLMNACGDKVVSPDAVREFHKNCGSNVVLKEYEGLYHELHNELESEKVFGDVMEFISGYC
ncbi:MAG: lysophospholipase [Oscillospiraceae bacterium]|nr:lysophospholipase [Oscillospiraceae bacterium]